MHKKAQDHFYHEEFYKAIDEYNNILDANSTDRFAMYRLTICSLLTNHRRQLPLDDILSYRKTQGRKDKFYFYWLGRIYFMQDNFKKAIETWEKFLKVDKYKSSEIIDETNDYIKWAEMAEAQYSHPENFEIEQLSEVINSPFTEFSPVYFKDQDELLFLSSKESLVEDETFIIYHSYRENGEWSAPTSIDVLGTLTAPTANIEVVNKGGRLYLYREHGKHGDIHYSEKSRSKWMTTLKLDAGLSSTKLESHFHINEKENRILFAHRNTGKRNDLDLYETKKDEQSGKWSKPAPFALEINTEFDEDYPFLSADEQTIYFSSKGFENLGGYDIFKSEYDPSSNKWATPTSVKYPTNSTDDDIQFKLIDDTGSGYFVSNRIDSYGSFDIFFFHESAKVLLSGTVKDGNGNPIDHAQIQFHPSRETGLVLKSMTDEDGRYHLRIGNDDDFKVEIYFHDALSHTEMISTPHAGSETVNMVLDFSLADEKKKEVSVQQLDDDPSYTTVEDIGSKFRQTNKVKLSNIYFQSGSSQLTEDNYGRLRGLLKALQDYPNLKIEIAGHTDNLGVKSANLELSKQRALSVANHLNAKGIKANRLVPRGYGDTRPLASNDDEKDGRELNRRIEVVVIE
ncbi:MAG: OmpA family protein [Reichenbachiella sp.]